MTRREGPSISVFFPAYNDAGSLPALVSKAFQTLETITHDFEVIVVNDGSQDDTGNVLTQLRGALGPRLKVVTHPENRGYGGALRTGFETSSKEWVFYTDGDGQYDVGELTRLWQARAPDTGLVNGYKLERQDPWHRVLIGRVYNRAAKLLFRIRLRDIDCDFRLIRRALISGAHLTSTSGTICVELVRKLEQTGCGVKEVGVHHYPRLYGRSQFFRWRSLWSTFRQLFRLWLDLVFKPNLKALLAYLHVRTDEQSETGS